MKATTSHVLVSAFIVGTSAIAAAQQTSPSSQQVDPGKFEYIAHCATCHGLTGLGDGPLSSYLNKTVPNLTTLSTRNGGVFPFARVYETIDGRREVGAHGPRDMPVWGQEYRDRGISSPAIPDHEAFVRGKILALTEYLYRLQAK
jgi:mono/diheme cytochrome c family protein